MRLIIQDDYENVGLWAAAYVLRRIRHHAPTAAKPFLLGLPTGSSPISMYKALIDFHQQGLVSFEHVISFNMDEYVGLPMIIPRATMLLCGTIFSLMLMFRRKMCISRMAWRRIC